MREFLVSIGYNQWILPVLLALPLLGALAVLAGRPADAGADEVESGAANRPRSVATLIFALEFVLSVGLWWAFDPDQSGWQQRFDVPWIQAWGVRFSLGL